MKHDIISFGSAVMDAFIETGIPEIHKEMCYRVGTKIVVDDLRFATGGGGTNTAVGFARLGLKTGYLGKLGNDAHADAIIKELKDTKITFLGTRSKTQPTGFSVILDSKQHDRTVLTYRGANDAIKFPEIQLNKIDTSWLYLSSMTGESHLVQEKVALWAQKKGIQIAFNPSSYITRKGVSFLRSLLRATTVLVLNDEEARDLVPTGDLTRGLHALGPSIVCITKGPQGTDVSDKKKKYFAAPNPIKIVERTGAGDAFACGFVSEYLQTKDIQKAITVGSVNAESVIQYIGAKEGLLHKNVAQKLLAKKNSVKIKEII